ncbi:L7Ae/L30e/S12e/Gadd45 family ribosomal protein [Mesoaciditoga lauensis]|uniref:L7Ae/L30e/S12e/Gadd45 family ribosomal protein n=1 Tax=Mesoaciditoga lauensis TaxID=1495039 RepID=UPI00055D41F6|nr:ribosomal L7Ae/L30e/S12e/Gadd45 family protein [Mesoaciditoga lauensis]
MKKNLEEKVIGLLGLAARSGKIVIGQKMVKRYITSDFKEKIVIFSSDYGESVESLLHKCKANDVPYLKLSIGKSELGMKIGKKEVSAVGITEATFAKGIRNVIFNG